MLARGMAAGAATTTHHTGTVREHGVNLLGRRVQSQRPSAIPRNTTTIPTRAAIDACQEIIENRCRCVNPSTLSGARVGATAGQRREEHQSKGYHRSQSKSPRQQDRRSSYGAGVHDLGRALHREHRGPVAPTTRIRGSGRQDAVLRGWQVAVLPRARRRIRRHRKLRGKPSWDRCIRDRHQDRTALSGARCRQALAGRLRRAEPLGGPGASHCGHADDQKADRLSRWD